MKKLFAVLLACAMLLSLTACGSKITDDWNKLVIGDKFPTPQKGKLQIGSNLDNMFSGSIQNVKEDYFYEYKDACIEAGYTIESESSGARYMGFNEEGYQVSISFVSNYINVNLYKPEELEEIEWPTSGIGAELPKPKSSLGKVNADRSDYFSITVGNMSIDEYQKYVVACEENGFVVDYSKSEKSYIAKNADGCKMYLTYEGCNRILITIEEIGEKTTTTTAEKAEDSLGSDFKEAMDAYEAFMNKYVDFMNKYQSNPTDLNLLADYATYMSDYAKFCTEFAEWEDEDLNAAELAYYVDVQARVTKKLLEVAG